MGIDNRMVGYVFLVDRKGRIRWRYVGLGKGRLGAACVRTGGVDVGTLPSNYFSYHTSLCRGTGRPSEEEIGSMLKCAHELYEESTSNVEAGSGKRSGKLNKRN